MRLIDADALKENCPTNLGAPIWLIDAAPTIDPVQHEHWERKKMLNSITGTWKSVCMCSGCRHTQLTESAFCGGCGAKMDGDSNE